MTVSRGVRRSTDELAVSQTNRYWGEGEYPAMRELSVDVEVKGRSIVHTRKVLPCVWLDGIRHADDIIVG